MPTPQFLFRKRFLVGLLIILILTPQTQKENRLLLDFNESGLFSSYLESKNVLNILTCVTIALFFVFLFV